MLQAEQPEIRVAMLSSVGGMAPQAEEAFRLGAVQASTNQSMKKSWGHCFARNASGYGRNRETE